MSMWRSFRTCIRKRNSPSRILISVFTSRMAFVLGHLQRSRKRVQKLWMIQSRSPQTLSLRIILGRRQERKDNRRTRRSRIKNQHLRGRNRRKATRSGSRRVRSRRPIAMMTGRRMPHVTSVPRRDTLLLTAHRTRRKSRTTTLVALSMRFFNSKPLRTASRRRRRMFLSSLTMAAV
jgi:hypothetical protein